MCRNKIAQIFIFIGKIFISFKEFLMQMTLTRDGGIVVDQSVLKDF